MLIAPLLFISCKKEKPAPSLNVDSLEMNYKNKESLNIENIDGDGLVIWTSKDRFVATVGPTGRVTAEHLGTTRITASFKHGYKYQQLECEVIVKPTIELYQKPIVEFGKSREYIKQTETRILDKEQENEVRELLIYKDPNAVDVRYLFHDDKLTAASVSLNKSTTELKTLMDFMTERYDIWFGDIPDKSLYWEKGNMIISVATQEDIYFILYFYLD